MVNRTKASLFGSKLIISAPVRISAPGFSGIYVVSMSLSVCVISISLSACMMSTRELGCVSVAAGCQAVGQHPVGCQVIC